MRCLRTWIAVNTHASAEGGLVHRGRAIAFKHRARQCAGVRRVPDHERAVDDDAGARAGWELVRIGVSCAIFENPLDRKSRRQREIFHRKVRDL